MAPRHKLATQGERVKENNSVGMRKDHKPTSPPKNASPRQLRSSTTAAAYSTPSEAFQKPSETSQELIDRPRKAQKRKHAAEDERSQKRLRKDPLSASVPAAASQDPVGVWQSRGKKRGRESVTESQLSKENLKRLERDLEKLERGTPDEMDPDDTFLDRVRKRAPSRQASLSDLNQDTASLRSQKSSVSNSLYRYEVLRQARIYVRPEPPPMEIQAQMDVIFEREIPEKRRKAISGIAKKISQEFIDNLRGAHREDDLVELVYEALRMMHKDQTFNFPRKADWDPSLKPDVQQKVWNWDALDQSNNKADDIIDRPNKRQQRERSFPSPNTSQSTMPPPAAPSQSKKDPVKTPRPDFTIGLRHSTISNALIKRGLSKFKADDFLIGLQCERKLSSDPTQNFLDVRFPILVIEGKAYATGKTVFEAQNQAAVSGVCMVNLQQQLTDLFEGVFSGLRGRKTHLAFSICTQGPQIEFWVHYALSEDNVRSHYMNIFRTCYGSLQGGLEDFLMDVERLMRWTKEEFLKEVADQLHKLANHALPLPGAVHLGAFQPSVAQPGFAQPAVSQPAVPQVGATTQPGIVQPGIAQPGVVQAAVGQPADPQPGDTQSGFAQQGVAQPAVGQPAISQAGATQPAAPQVGVTQPGVAQSTQADMIPSSAVQAMIASAVQQVIQQYQRQSTPAVAA